MSTHEQTADVLDGAADVIERDGWHQGSFYPGASECEDRIDNVLPKCVRGAIRQAADNNFYRTLSADDALGSSLGLKVSTMRPSSIPRWNDAPERTKQEVLDALRLAAKSERRLADGIES